MPGRNLPSHTWKSKGEFHLEHGGILPEIQIAYETWGKLSPRRDNVVVILHALSGSGHAFSSAQNPTPGWWEVFLTEQSPIHPRDHFIICANLLGGCYGSTGPSSIDPRTGKKFRMSFPQITLNDMVQSQRLLLEDLGIDRPVTLIGGSMGGMIILEWAVKCPQDVGRAIVLASPARSYPQTIALRAVQREAILNDPLWNGGDYDDDHFPERGLALARKIGVITYRSHLEFQTRFGRDVRDPRPHFLEGFFEIQSYLNHQGEKFVARFDPNTYLYFSRAMDLFDVSEGYSSLVKALARIEARTLLVAIDSDFLCPPHEVSEVFEAMKEAGRQVRLETIHTVHGHDAFLLEIEQIHALLKAFL